jgi:hypothetical protein
LDNQPNSGPEGPRTQPEELPAAGGDPSDVEDRIPPAVEADSARAVALDAHPVEPSQRNPRVDALRGLFLVVMTLDHLPYHPLLHLTNQSLGFVSAAEGFVFVSGLVSAWVYGAILVKHGERPLRRRILRRARDIYLTHLFLLSLPLLASLCARRTIMLSADLWRPWWHGSPRGILPMYAVFLLLTPTVLKQIAKGHAAWIWAASIALWLAAQFGVGTPGHTPWLQLGFFNILAWQLLFFAGLFFGCTQAAASSGWGLPVPVSRMLLPFSLALATGLFIVRHQSVFHGHLALLNMHLALSRWRSINHPLRLINFAAWAYLIWWVPRSVDSWLKDLPAIRFLRYLGRHSLQVFAWSVFVSYVAFGYRSWWASRSPAWQMLLALIAAFSLSLPAWLHGQWKLMSAHSTSRLDGSVVTPS